MSTAIHALCWINDERMERGEGRVVDEQRQEKRMGWDRCRVGSTTSCPIPIDAVQLPALAYRVARACPKACETCYMKMEMNALPLIHMTFFSFVSNFILIPQDLFKFGQTEA